MAAAGSGPDPLAGAHLGKEYWVVERIGDGGMGVVYLVEHRGLKKQFAAKILSRDLTENAEARARFEIEARAASQLDHENIVNVTDYGISVDDRPFLVMELLRGRTLYQRMTDGVLQLAEAVSIIVPVCAALGAAHEAGIVHRDVKPENVFLVTRPGGRIHVKVLDFGIAKATVDTPRVTKLGQVLGSPLFMAPEACRGEEVDGRADIYSVGILAYQMVTGRLPFEDTNMLRLLQMHTSRPVPPPRSYNPELPEEVEAVILRALAKDRADRYQHVDELAGDLIDALPEGMEAQLRAPVLTPSPVRTPTPMRSPSGLSEPSGILPGSRTMPGADASRQSGSARVSPGGDTVSVPSGTFKLGSAAQQAAAQHAALEGGPTLVARPSGKSGKVATVPEPSAPAGSAPPSMTSTPVPGAGRAAMPSPDEMLLAAQAVSASSLRITGGGAPADPRASTVPVETIAAPVPPSSAAATMSTKSMPARRRGVLVGVALFLLVAAVAVPVWRSRRAPAAGDTASTVPAATPTPTPPAATAETPPALPGPALPAPAAATVPPPGEAPPPVAPARVRFRVTSLPPGAEVVLAGKKLGTTPLDTEVDASSIPTQLELRVHGHRRELRELTLDQDVELAISLDGRRAPARPSPTPPRVKPTPTPPPDLEIRGRR